MARHQANVARDQINYTPSGHLRCFIVYQGIVPEHKKIFMKTIFRSSWVNPLLWVTLCTALFSFNLRPGAHSFQVYLDSKLMLEQYVNAKNEVPKLAIDQSASKLVVKYNECGRTVSGRTITIKDDKNKILKAWNFEGETSGYKDGMVCKVKDIFALKENGSNTLKVYYSSKDFPEGQLVVTLVLNGETKASLN
jgi:hypothetical protein